MKCQKCNKNEANIQYREYVNGKTREIRLCEDCARETGLLGKTENMFADMERRMIGAFTPFSVFGGLGGGCSPVRGFLGGGSSFFSEPFFAEPFFDNDPVEDMQLPTEEKKEKKASEKEPAETEAEMKARLLDAIADERYEDAAKLRDKIKKLKGE